MDWTDAAGRALKLVRTAGEHLGDIVEHEELNARVDRVAANIGPYGVDPFGFDPAYVKKVVGLASWFYRYYFRCEAYGLENISDGRCLIVANHSGQLPFDGAMIGLSVFLDREPPRVVRSMLERFVPDTPFASTFLQRCGQILGTPANCRRLLNNEEAILVFPEGVRGLNKTWSKRYQLQQFGTGFMRLALENHTPIVPCAVVGAEEQAPSFHNLRGFGKLFGFPSWPVTPQLLPLPLPVKYRIYFGEPMEFEGDGNEVDDKIRKDVNRVSGAIQDMLDAGVAGREHVFW